MSLTPRLCDSHTVRVTNESLVPVLVLGVNNPLVDPIIREGKLQSVLSVTDQSDTILICQKNVNYAQYTPVLYKDNNIVFVEDRSILTASDGSGVPN